MGFPHFMDDLDVRCFLLTLEVQSTSSKVAGRKRRIHGLRIPDPTNGSKVWSTWTSWVKERMEIGTMLF